MAVVSHSPHPSHTLGPLPAGQAPLSSLSLGLRTTLPENRWKKLAISPGGGYKGEEQDLKHL